MHSYVRIDYTVHVRYLAAEFLINIFNYEIWFREGIWNRICTKRSQCKKFIRDEVVNTFCSFSFHFLGYTFSHYSLNSSPSTISPSIHFLLSCPPMILGFFLLDKFQYCYVQVGKDLGFCTQMFTVDRNNSELGLL